eukprot:6192178-Pleurochrysis_carterae.AAC.1
MLYCRRRLSQSRSAQRSVSREPLAADAANTEPYATGLAFSSDNPFALSADAADFSSVETASFNHRHALQLAPELVQFLVLDRNRCSQCGDFFIAICRVYRPLRLNETLGLRIGCFRETGARLRAPAAACNGCRTPCLSR